TRIVGDSSMPLLLSEKEQQQQKVISQPLGANALNWGKVNTAKRSAGEDKQMAANDAGLLHKEEQQHHHHNYQQIVDLQCVNGRLIDSDTDSRPGMLDCSSRLDVSLV